MIDKYYEYSDNKQKCKYNIVVEGCRSCLFETLCHYENMKKKQKEKSDLYSFSKKKCDIK